jgi:hypothetical protein
MRPRARRRIERTDHRLSVNDAEIGWLVRPSARRAPRDGPVVDAIHHATGAWITELPATPARVLAEIRAPEDERPHEPADPPAEEAAP